MLTYEQAKNIVIAKTVPGGKVYYAGDAGDFYIFIIVDKDFNMDIGGAIFGTTFTAINKDDKKVWTVDITDIRLKNVKRLTPKHERKVR